MKEPQKAASTAARLGFPMAGLSAACWAAQKVCLKAARWVEQWAAPKAASRVVLKVDQWVEWSAEMLADQ